MTKKKPSKAVTTTSSSSSGKGGPNGEASAAAKNGSKTAATKDDENGHHCPPAPPVSSFSYYYIAGLLVAILAFGLGIVTPPLAERLLVVWKNDYYYSDFHQRPQKVTERTLMTKHSQQDDATTTNSGTNSAAASTASQELEQQQRYPCTDDLLQQFWHERPVPGFHIVCLKKNDDNNKSIALKLYPGGTRRLVTVEFDTTAVASWETLKEALVQHLHLTNDDGDNMRQPWALFTPQGERVVDASRTEDEIGWFAKSMAERIGTLLLYQGGQFLWPGVFIGFEREIALYSIMPEGSPAFDDEKNTTVTLETLSLVPLVLSVKGFLSQEECQHIQKVAEPSMAYSQVVLMDRDAGRPASDFRTSQTTFVKAGRDDDLLTDIDYRTASLVRIPRNHQETVQVLRYGPTEKYTTHHDYFDPQFYQNDPNTLRLIGGNTGRRNRMVTVFWYLSDVPAGGETVFPRFNHSRERSIDDCETGLKVQPETGKVIIFYSMTADGKTDSNSLHGACPVKEGVKWAANKWVWNEPMRYVPA